MKQKQSKTTTPAEATESIEQTATAAKPAKKKKAAAKPAKKAAAKDKPAKKAAGELREGTKGHIALEMIRSKKGATLDELMKATKWQRHSVRGFVAGMLKTKLGLKVTSTRLEDGSRHYQA